MPQLDAVAYLSQFSWFVLLYIIFFSFISNFFLPTINEVLISRNINYDRVNKVDLGSNLKKQRPFLLAFSLLKSCKFWPQSFQSGLRSLIYQKFCVAQIKNKIEKIVFAHKQKTFPITKITELKKLPNTLNPYHILVSNVSALASTDFFGNIGLNLLTNHKISSNLNNIDATTLFRRCVRSTK